MPLATLVAGSSNAYTDMEDTNYYFSLNSPSPSALPGALDRLASFFKEPLFDENMVEREMRAVDSEFRNGLTDDGWRQFQLLKHTANPSHPMSKFGCGNYATLSSGDGPGPDLRAFWLDHYHASNCKLCVVGRSPLPALSSYASSAFSSVRPSPPGFLRYSGSPVPAFPKVGIVREFRPMKDRRSVKLSFPVPPCEAPGCRESKPHRLSSHLMGYEGENSLHSRLVGRGLIRGLSAGIGVDGSGFSMFTVTAALTEMGGDRVDDVVGGVFQWIR